MRYLMAAVTLVTCPCHVPILAVLLAGTALGATLAEHAGVAVSILAVVFLASGWLTVRLFARATNLRADGR